ncbi:MAG: ABC transporter permease [Chitinophagaceae bacterium]
MARFLLRKLLYATLVMLGVMVLVFVLFQGLGDPARLVVGQSADPKTQANIRRELYLDQPKWKQFLFYLNDVSPIALHTEEGIAEKGLKGIFIGGETRLALKQPYLRRSYQSRRPVADLLLEALPGTLVLSFAAILFATVFGIALGMLAAVKKYRWPDYLIQFGSITGISAPSFFTGIIIAFIFGFVWHRFTGLSMTGSLYGIDPVNGKFIQWKNLILPAITLGIRPLAIITQLTRSSMLDVLSQDYIRTARAKGLSSGRILFRHALPNALNPVITAITGWFAELLAGAFFVEYIFGWRGVGRITVEALEKLDFPVLMGSVLLTAFFFTMMNVFADLLYRITDPRVKIH